VIEAQLRVRPQQLVRNSRGARDEARIHELGCELCGLEDLRLTSTGGVDVRSEHVELAALLAPDVLLEQARQGCSQPGDFGRGAELWQHDIAVELEALTLAR
jgi:hypothetical protein